MTRVLVPRADGAATAAALAAAGFTPVAVPLMDHVALAWAVPEPPPAAVILTSAAAARHGGPGLARLRRLPCFCVGTATAAAASAAGFADIRIGPGTAQNLIDAIATTGLSPVLHLAGQDRTAVTVPAGLHIQVVAVYAARLLPLPALPVAEWAVLHSARLAGHFASEWDRLGGQRAALAIAAISPAVASTAGDGWRQAAVAAAPSDDALLAALAAACEKPA